MRGYYTVVRQKGKNGQHNGSVLKELQDDLRKRCRD